MPVFHDSALIGAAGAAAAGGGGYAISRSLRFNSSDSAYLSRTPASAGNRKTWTWAGWVKRSALGGTQVLFGAWQNSGNTNGILLLNDQIFSDCYIGGSLIYSRTAPPLLRDTSAWYHVVVAFDTTQGTASNRFRLYINGIEITGLTGTAPGSSVDGLVSAAQNHWIGATNASSNFFSGYLADIHFIDGQALDPTSFGEFDATTGVWVPKAFTGSYGTNGFQLKFEDNSSNTATTLGKDTSGNGNNWTPNNLSVTAGAGNDSLVDVPTNGAQTDTGVGGEVRGNYAVLLDQYVTDKTRLTMANGNLDVTFNNSGSSSSALSTIGVSSGKWYAEFTVNQAGSYYAFVGIILASTTNAESLGYAGSYAYVNNTGNKVSNGSGVSYGATWTAGDVIGVALDLDAGTLTFYKNGTSQGQAYSSISGTYIIGCTGFLNWKFSANFGQRPFVYPVSGFKALCTANLPAPLVTKPSTVMDVLLWTGNGVNGRAITGLNFSPDFVWIKNRLNLSEHSLFDTVRGVAKTLYTNKTDAELSSSAFGHVSSFDAAGFTLTDGSSGPYPNLATNWNNSPIAAWCWDAGSSTVTNNSGSITGAQVRANTSAGFSVVTYTGNGSNATVGHGLGVAPKFYIIKRRTGGTGNWIAYTTVIDGSLDYLALNGTAAKTDSSLSAPTSTVFSLLNDTDINGNASTYVAYCFAPVAGYSSFGSYVGVTGGAFVYTGFRPRFIMIKNANDPYDGGSLIASHSWVMIDTARNTYNRAENWLGANKSNSEATSSRLDILSNGFKIRVDGDSGSDINGSLQIYAAFAESPFQYARAR